MLITTRKKLSITELSALYDRLYDIADRLFKKHNPCKIHTKNGKLYCINHNEHWNATLYLCCYGCIDRWENGEQRGNHWSENGCTTKCLSCKLYLCGYAKGKNRRLYHQLRRLKQFAYEHGLPHEYFYYISKEEWLEQIKRRNNYE